MRIRLSHVEVEGTPAEIEWFADHEQDHLRMQLSFLNYRVMEDASDAAMPEPDDEPDDEPDNRVLVVHRGGKADATEVPSPEGEDDE